MNLDKLHRFAAQLRDFIDRATDASPATEAEFNGLAQHLYFLQVESNPVYQAWCQPGGLTPFAPGGWRTLPALPTDAFKELPVSCLPERERTTEFRSSGTTGHRPSRHFHHTDSLALYGRSVRQGFAQRIPNPIPRILWSLTPPPQEAPHSSLVHMANRLIGDFGSTESRFVGRNSTDGWVVNTTSIWEDLRMAREPLFLLGTAFNFVHLLDSRPAGGEDLRLPAGSQILETGGYKGRSRELPRAELHEQLALHLGIPRSAIVTEYGMSELSSQAYSEASEDGRGQILKFPAWARALVVSPETSREVAEGERGLLRVIDLANVWSVLAIQTGDLAIRRGAHFELIGRAPTAEARGCSLMSVTPP